MSDASGDDDTTSEKSGEQDDGPQDLPQALQRVFDVQGPIIDYTQTKEQLQMINCSVFNKVSKKVDTTTFSMNVEEQRLKKANELYESSSLFKTQIRPTDKKINPLLIPKLERKQNKKDKEETAGKMWGHMKKVELTDELRADLRAIKLRNQLFSNRFYKTSDSKKLPEYFQIGTVVDDSRDLSSRSERWTKKQRKGNVA